MAINSFHVARISRFLPQWFVQWEQNFLFPIAGAVSNVNLNMMLPEKNHKIPVRRYLRATCATPFAPVIVCLTTHQNACTLTSTNFEASATSTLQISSHRHLQSRQFLFAPRQGAVCLICHCGHNHVLCCRRVEAS